MSDQPTHNLGILGQPNGHGNLQLVQGQRVAERDEALLQQPLLASHRLLARRLELCRESNQLNHHFLLALFRLLLQARDLPPGLAQLHCLVL